ncbi:MAG: L-threonylcarbamoyladenylate synthase [Armatimonadota bacterium]
METRILRVDPAYPDSVLIDEAGMAIRQGKLVGFPTETVYGLAADAFNLDAVARVFDVKGRPTDKPLPVQVADIDEVYRLTSDLPDYVRMLMDCFFPGPLTLVLKASSELSGMITAGTGKVGIRMPDHRVALAFIRSAGTPIVAPSANTSGFDPPTDAKMLLDDLGGKIEYIIDAGPTRIQTASTVVDVTEKPFRIIREGSITEEMLNNCLAG